MEGNINQNGALLDKSVVDGVLFELVLLFFESFIGPDVLILEIHVGR